MGTYINIGNFAFQRARNSEYVDKSMLIAVVNSTLFTEQCMTCVTRCRRFGKSMAARMLCAYYDHSCDSRQLFEDLKIASHPSFEQHLNKYPVIFLDTTDFTTRNIPSLELATTIEQKIREEILETYPDVAVKADDDLMDVLTKVARHTGEKFIFIIDEWDAICRQATDTPEAMDSYVKLLHRMFKGSDTAAVFAGVYMTGILPIKRYKTQSALNNFVEYSMVSPGEMAGLFGFTKDEVKTLALKHSMDYDELEKWYDGYQIGPVSSIFNPNSVMMAVRRHWCESYWSKTAAYDTVANYISMNFEGLKEAVVRMVAGERCAVDTSGFINDLTDIRSKDDVLTILIHLGYLSYDRVERECYIPNQEVAAEMVHAVKDIGMPYVAKAIEKSQQLLKATLRGDEAAVAKAIDTAHDENTSIIAYNDENSMGSVLAIAYYAARDKYIIHREYASGKGFADLVLIPRKGVDSPAIIVELKYDKTADTAISQILRKDYPAKVAEYSDNLLLVGISYDKESKKHECKITYATDKE